MHFESVQFDSTLRLFFSRRCSDSSSAVVVGAAGVVELADRAVELPLLPGSAGSAARRWLVLPVVAPGPKTAGFSSVARHRWLEWLPR